MIFLRRCVLILIIFGREKSWAQNSAAPDSATAPAPAAGQSAGQGAAQNAGAPVAVDAKSNPKPEAKPSIVDSLLVNDPTQSAAGPPVLQDPQGYSFNPLSVKRDPFLIPPGLGKGGANELTRFDLNEMNLVAVLHGSGSAQAMLVLPNGNTHIVQVGDAIGRRNGKVFKISSTEVVVKESFRDYQSRLKSDFTTMVLAQ